MQPVLWCWPFRGVQEGRQIVTAGNEGEQSAAPLCGQGYGASKSSSKGSDCDAAFLRHCTAVKLDAFQLVQGIGSKITFPTVGATEQRHVFDHKQLGSASIAA